MRALAALSRCCDRLQQCCKGVYGLYKESPMVFCVILVISILLILLGTLFHKIFSWLAGPRGAIFLDISLLFLLIRDVSRLLLFPGSFFLYKRNLEAMYRVDIARQYWQNLKQLHLCLCHISKNTVGAPGAITAESVLRGCTVVECISKSFRMQQNDKVRLSTEQVEMLAMTSALDSWLKEAKIQRRAEGSADVRSAVDTRPLVEWLREETSNVRRVFGFISSPMSLSLKGIELVDAGHEASRKVGQVDQLLTLLNDLRNEKASWWSGTMRFLQVPTLGSLDQLRADMQMRYHAVHCWVRTKRGNKFDGMFIPCNPDTNCAEANDVAIGEDIPLTNFGGGPAFSGPTIVWCNPNAGYYETMVYQTTILDFYLERGCNIFLFNWTGYGRSTGYVQPNAIPDDGEAVIEFLKSKGITQIGIHGRSIGNLASCYLARKYPEVVKFLVADRTFSKLNLVAKFTYGDWAYYGLLLAQLPRTINANFASITPHFLETKCHKVMVFDPKDAVIPDLAALRTEVAHQTLARMSSEEKLGVEDEQFYKLLDAWRFFTSFFGEHEEDDEDTIGGETRSARQPTFSASNDYVRVKVADSVGETSPAQKKNSATNNGEKVDVRWLQDHMSAVRSAIGTHSDQVRLALDVVVECLDAGGLNLHDVLGELPDNPCSAMKAWLANLQVWGSIGNPRDASSSFASTASSGQAGVSEFELESFLRKSDAAYIPHRQQIGRKRIDELVLTLSPDAVADYQRQLSRAQIIYVRRELRRRLAALEQAFRNDTQGTETERIREVVLGLLGEVERFINRLARFFKSVDLMLSHNSTIGRSAESLASEGCSLSDSSDDKVDGLGRPQRLSSSDDRPESVKPRPIIDRSICGHVIHTDCGHNGVLDESEFRLIALHMRVAHFGRQPGEAP